MFLADGTGRTDSNYAYGRGLRSVKPNVRAGARFDSAGRSWDAPNAPNLDGTIMNILVVCRTSAVVGFLSALVLAASVPHATEPAHAGATPAAATVSGTVRLTANLYDERGKVTGERVFSDADGVRVQLRRPNGTIDSTVTSDGRYSFSVGVAGKYESSCSVVAGNDTARSTIDLAVGAGGVLAPLSLGPAGEVRTYPNPFGSTGLSIEYDAATEQQTEVIVYALSGEVVWKYAPGPVKGLNHIHWMGTSMEHAALPAGAYWVVVQKDGRHHSNLVFKP